MVHFRLDGIDAAQIELADRVVTVAPRNAASVPAGRYRLRWRTGEGRWRRSKPIDLRPDNEWVVRIGRDGPRLMDLRAATR